MEWNGISLPPIPPGVLMPLPPAPCSLSLEGSFLSPTQGILPRVPLYLHSQSEAFSETTGRVRVPLVYARPEPFSHTLAAASCVPRPSCGKPKGKDSSSLIFTPSTNRGPGALQTHRWLDE